MGDGRILRVSAESGGQRDVVLAHCDLLRSCRRLDYRSCRHMGTAAGMAAGPPRSARAQGPLPSLSRYIDPVPDAAVAVTRALLGCAAGWLLHDEITGAYAALAVGASAPALLAGLGKATTPAEAIWGQSDSHPASSPGDAQAQEHDAERQVAESSRWAFARRYWNTLIGHSVSTGTPTVGRGRTGYTFWQRYWAHSP